MADLYTETQLQDILRKKAEKLGGAAGNERATQKIATAPAVSRNDTEYDIAEKTGLFSEEQLQQRLRERINKAPKRAEGAMAATQTKPEGDLSYGQRHTLPVSLVTQQVAAKQQRAAAEIRQKNDAFTGSSDQTRAMQEVVDALQAKLDGIPQQKVELTPQQQEAVIRSRGLYNPQPAKTKQQEELEGQIQYLKDKIDSIKAANIMKTDMDTLESWPEEDKALMDTALAHTESGITDLVGLRVRVALDKKYGQQTVTRILESAKRNQNAKKAQDAAEAGQAGGDNLLNTAFSIPASWLSSVMAAPGQMLGSFTGTRRYPNADPYTAGTELGVWAENVQAATAENAKQHAEYTMAANGFSEQAQNMAGELAASVYQVGVGVADNLARAAAFGGVGSLALAGISSFSSTYRQAAENGASGTQAMAMGVVSGFLEIATEKIPLDNLLDGIAKAGSQSWGSIVKQALLQGGIEATTEEVNYLGNVLAQSVLLRESSDYYTMVRNAMDGGKSYAEAVHLADQQIIMHAGKTAAMAFFQGAGASAVGSVGSKLMPGNLLQQRSQERQKEEAAESQTLGNVQQAQNQSIGIKDQIRGKRGNMAVVNGETGAQGGRLTVDDLVGAIMPTGKKRPAQAAQTAEGKGVDISDLLDETVAQLRGAPVDSIQAAVDSYRQTGSVTNKQAEDILHNAKAVRTLIDETGMKLPDTASGKRQAVKEAVAKLASAETKNQLNIDNAQPAKYNETITGGEQNERAGSFGEDQTGVSGVYENSGNDGEGRRERDRVSVGSGLVLLSSASQDLLSQRGVVNMELHESSADNAAFSAALDNARAADPVHGWAVTPKSREELDNGSIRTYMDDNASTGFAIAPDGDIEAVFANKAAGAPKGSTRVTIPVAIANGGTKLDCYGAGLVRLYSQYGFVPVARCTFNAEYANDGWTPDKGTPDIYFMMHNGDSADAVVERFGAYHIPTTEELSALPEMEYDDAYEYRDQLLEREQTAFDTAAVGGYDNNTNTGGVNYGTGEQNNWIESEENRGSAQHNGETQSGARTENGNRSGVPEALGRGEQIFREAFVRKRHNRGLERKHIPFKDSDYAAVETDTPLHNVQSELSREYGCKSHVIKAAAWTKKVPAYAYQGEVYISEGIDAETLKEVVPHEATHVMKQVGFVPYVEFVGRTPDMMNLNNGYAQMFLDKAAAHVEVDPSSGNEADILRIYDELNAAMYSAHIGGDLNDSAKRAMAVEAFPNLDAYLAELSGIHEQFKQEQKGKRVPAADESVGAAPSGFDPISHLQYEYGTIPEGEKAVRDDSLPVSTDGKNRVSYTARTAKGAEVTPDEFADLIDKEVTKDCLTYIPIKNSDTTQKAVDTIKEMGWLQAKADWHAAVHAGKTGADVSAVGALLLNNAANAGDKDAWLEILHDYQLLGTHTAQGLQAFRILKTLAPDDKLYMIRRSVKQMLEDMRLDMDIELDEELLHEFEEAETDEARDEVLDKITQSVADQIPSTFMDKFTALRYMNMLGNLRTQIRNVAGNAGMKLVSSAKNAVAAGLEAIASKLSGGKLKRTKSFTVNKEQLSAARADFDTFRDVVLGGGKYNDSAESTAFAQGVRNRQTVFKGKNIVSKGLEGYRKATNWAMEQGDLVFSKAAYARALAGYLKANGVTETDYSNVDPALMDEARLYAAKEAQEQTFRDTNWLSGWASKIGRRNDTPAVGKLISEGVMPFRKTPANVLVRAEEYSPLGVINSVYYSIKAMQKDSDITGAQVINSWAKTLTGSGIFVLGMLLSNLGILAGGPDEDEGKEKFEELSGYQNYALQFGDVSYTIDWLTPAAMPLLMGAELWELIQDGGFEGKDLEQALLSIADPMIQMSMLQGIDDTLENISYADSNLGQLAVNAALSYLTQGLTNTALGQIERSFEGGRMTTYVDKESAVPAWLQRTIGKASAKMPGFDYNQVPYINAWGEEEENPDWAAGLAYNMLSPGYIEKGVSDDIYNELVRLDAAQEDVNVYPASPDKTITINKETRNLSSVEWVALAKAQGQTAKGIVEDIISSKYYDGLSDEKKAEAIRYAYDYAREHARVETLEGYDTYSAKWMNDIAGKEAEAILRKVATGEKGNVDTFAGLPIDKAAMLSEAIEELFDKPKEVKPDGTKYTSVRTVQKVETVAQSSLTEKEQQAAMEDILDDKAYEKYLKILDAGYDTDDYAESYRIFLDTEKTKTKSKREATIRELMKEMNLSYAAAKKLYEIYEPKK